MDPITTALAAFAAVQKTVQVIKQAHKTVGDVASLGPLLGQYFGAKQEATKAIVEAKKHGGSSLAKAIEIEMQLLANRKFEEEIKMVFFQTGNVDVWENITRRVAESEHAQVEEAKRAKAAAIKKARKTQEIIEIVLAVSLLVLLVPPLIYAVIVGVMYFADKG